MCVRSPAGHFFRLVVFRTLFASPLASRFTASPSPNFLSASAFCASLGKERQKTLARGISARSECSSWALHDINVDVGIYESGWSIFLRRNCFGDHCLIFAVLTLRDAKPSADSCGDLFLEEPFQGLLPAGCGSEAVFNFSWEKEIDPYGSGDDNYDDDDDYEDGDGYIFTTPVPTLTLRSSTAAANLRTTAFPSSFTTRNFSLAPNRTVTRLLPRFTPSLESRHSSFQHLLRLHMNTFNQRLSMLEKNTLDMKESIQRMEEQQKLLSSQLAQLISVRAAEEKGEKVGELERSYADMETRLHRLEGRLEILIDGFTALAQEMNKMKRARHASRSPPERRELPSLTTVRPLPLYPSTPAPVPSTAKPFSSRAPVPESIPTPSLAVTRTSTSSPRQGRKRKPAAANTSAPPPFVTKSSTSSATTLKKIQTQSAAKSTPQATAKPEAAGRRRSTAKRVSKTSNTKPKGAQKEAVVTTFQLEPPSHNSKPNQTRKKNSTSPSKGNARNKAFRSDEPDPKKTREAVTVSEGHTKELAEPHEGDADSDQRKTDRKTNSSTRRAITAAKPAKATAATQKSSTAAGSKSTSPKAKATVTKKKSSTSAKRKSVTPKSKKNSGRKVTKKSQQKTSNVMDLLQLLSGDRKSAKQSKNGESSLHVVLGRLAIPIKIIPDF